MEAAFIILCSFFLLFGIVVTCLCGNVVYSNWKIFSYVENNFESIFQLYRKRYDIFKPTKALDIIDKDDEFLIKSSKSLERRTKLLIYLFVILIACIFIMTVVGFALSKLM